MLLGSKKAYLMIIACLFVLVGCGQSNSSPNYVNVGTAGTGGAYYPIGIAVAEVLSQNLDIDSSAEVTGGAVDNVELVQNGEVELAISQSPMVYAGYHGNDPYSQENDNIATLFNGLSKGVFQLVVSKSSGIESIADLEGKRVVLGPSGGGAINVISDILDVYGLSIDDLNDTYVSYDEGISMLTDDNVDAVIVQSAAPAPAITELAASRKEFNLVSIEPDKLEVILDKLTYLNQIDLPADMYNTAEDITTVYLTNMMIVKKSLDEDLVYNITKTIFENIETIQESHPAAQGLTLEDATNNVPIPLHPGAERYFKEQGVLD